MQTNPTQNINANYGMDDVFKPAEANQIVRSIHYDFVATQEMFDAYRGASNIVDMGYLLFGDDGYQGEPIKGPISIYIAAKEHLDDIQIAFGDRFFNAFDFSDYKIDDHWDAEKTVDMVNIYSAAPYRIYSLYGGFNFWTTPEAYVSIYGVNPGGSGITKIGAYMLESDIAYDLGDREDIQIVCMTCLNSPESQGYTVSPNSGHVISGYRPAVVKADWMHSGANGSFWYVIKSTDTSKPGLFHQLVGSLDFSTDAVIYEDDGSTINCYHRDNIIKAGGAITELTYCNPVIGKKIRVVEDGTITRSKLRGSVNIVALYDTNGTTLKYLKDSDITLWDMPTGIDYLAQLQDILGMDIDGNDNDSGNNLAPCIRFRLKIDAYNSYVESYATLCNFNWCGYMFTTEIPHMGHRFICVRYHNPGDDDETFNPAAAHSGITSNRIQVTVSENPINIGTGVIENPITP